MGTAIDEHFCFRCNKELPFLHSSREEVNFKTQTHWFILYCPRCGTVTSVEKDTFNYSNLLPRIGKLKSALFILLIGAPYIAITWYFKSWIGGILITITVLGLAYLVARGKVYEVENCLYERHGQYPELVFRR